MKATLTKVTAGQILSLFNKAKQESVFLPGEHKLSKVDQLLTSRMDASPAPTEVTKLSINFPHNINKPTLQDALQQVNRHAHTHMNTHRCTKAQFHLQRLLFLTLPPCLFILFSFSPPSCQTRWFRDHQSRKWRSCLCQSHWHSQLSTASWRCDHLYPISWPIDQYVF